MLLPDQELSDIVEHAQAVFRDVDQPQPEQLAAAHIFAYCAERSTQTKLAILFNLDSLPEDFVQNAIRTSNFYDAVVGRLAYLKGLIIVKESSISCSWCMSSVYKILQLLCNADATIKLSQNESLYFNLNSVPFKRFS